MRESTRHRLAFDAYVDQGAQRSLEALQRLIAADPAAFGFKRAPSQRTVHRWSTALHWQDRLADLEREARQRDAEAQLQGLMEMNRRHAQEGMALQQKGIARLQAVAEDDLTPGEAIRAVTEGVRLERLGRGEVTDRSEIQERADHDLAGFSLAELRALARTAAARAGGDRPPQPRRSRRLDAGLPDDPGAADGTDAGPA